MAYQNQGMYSPPTEAQPPENSCVVKPAISTKICKINARDKVVDFRSRLIPAKVEDFANIHGCGGKDHAANSTIECVICDFTRGTGERSVTVSYRIEAEDIQTLYQAGLSARLGTLSLPTAEANSQAVLERCNAALNQMRSWYKSLPFPDGSLAVPMNGISQVGKLISEIPGLLNTQRPNVPLFTYGKEKNNPYVKDERGYVPVSKISVSYSPYRSNGELSNFPWLLQIENFRAPLKVRSNGSTAHDSSKAVDRKTAFINIGRDDFVSAMVAVDRFIRLWECRYIPTMNKAYAIMAEARAQQEAEKQEMQYESEYGNSIPYPPDPYG